MNISFISVFPPYRGGIATHSHLILNELKKNNNVQAINFIKLYPSIFFPGKSQYDNSEKIIGERILNSTNPLKWKKVVSKIKENKSELIIFKFWHPFFIPCYNYIIKKIKKDTNIKIAMIFDNIFPHEPFPFSKILLKKLLLNVDIHVVQSSKVEKELKKIAPNALYDKVFHPIYNNYPCAIDKEDAKSKLNITEANVVLFFGLIRDYKGLDKLILSMEKVFEIRSDVKLLIAGECYSDKQKYISMIKKSKYSDKILWKEEYINEDEVSVYFSAANLVVLPYVGASQSGIVPLSYHYNKPVIVSDLEGLKEVVDIGKTGYVFNLKSEYDLSDSILKFLKNYNENYYSDNIESYKSNFAWSNFESSIRKLLAKLDS